MSNWWVLHDPEQGHSSQIETFAGELSNALKRPVSCMWVCDNMTIEDTEKPDGVVLWCALRWYVHKRATIPGRPWIGAVSWCFDDLMSLISDKSAPGINLIDAGVNSLWTNCPAYVQHTSAAYQCSFNLKPLKTKTSPPNDTRYSLGVVVPNISDRDFSQVLWTLKYLKANLGHLYELDGPNIYLSERETRRLPGEFLDWIAPEKVISLSPTALDEIYRDLNYAIIPPRITDLRGGVVPPEIYQAISAGCGPLVIQHPVLAKQLEGVLTIRSLKQYACILSDIYHNPFSEHPPRHRDWDLADSPTNLAWKITRAYQEANRASS